MAIESIKVNQTVRPIRFAFMVSVAKPATIYEAISYSTILWGGIFNLIIPVWRKFPSRSVKLKTLGIIDTVDPDFIVNLTNLPIPKAITDSYSGTVFQKSDLIVKDKNEKLCIKKGMTIIPLLKYVFDKHIRTIKEYSRAVIVSIPNNCINRKLLVFMHGYFPKQFNIDYSEHYKKALKPRPIKYSTQILKNFNFPNRITPIDFTANQTHLSYRGDTYGSHVIIIGNKNSFSDLIEFWNIRAMGKAVLFVPIQDYLLFKRDIKTFIDASYFPITDKLQRIAIVMRGPTVKQQDFEKVATWIKQLTEYKLPRIGIPLWIGENTVPCSITASEAEEISVFDGSRLTAFKACIPDFITKRTKLEPDGHSWALIIGTGKSYEHTHFFNLPKDKAFENTARYNLYLGSKDDSRLGHNGLVVFQHFLRDTIQIWPIETKTVFKKYFKHYGYEIKPSPPGRYADGIIKFMGRLHFDCRVFKIKGVRLVLDALGRRKRLTTTELDECKNILLRVESGTHKKTDLKYLRKIVIEQLPRDTKALTVGNIKKILNKNWCKEYEDLILFAKQREKLTANMCFKYLATKKIIKPGMYFKCKICGAEDWYHIDEYGNRYSCRYCFSEQDIPFLETHEWHYKSNGLFMLPNIGEGSIAVILSLWRFEDIGHVFEHKYITSHNFKNIRNNRQFEIDFISMFTGKYRGGYDLVLGEARNFVDFTRKDFRNIARLASKLPCKPYLCFSTLKNNFSKYEKTELKKLMNKGFRVIAMTRHELEPYYLHERFKKITKAYLHDLEELSHNTIALNINK